MPHPGGHWRPEGDPARQPHEYIRNGTAKVLTLFHPADGRVRVEGVTACPNGVLHPWLKRELSAVLAALPQLPPTAKASRAAWERWQAGLAVKPTLAAELPPLRMLLVLDNLAGHKTPELVLWLFAHGIMPVYTPVGGSWLNMAESIQRVLKRRALDGQHPTTTAEIIAWFEAVAQALERASRRRSSGAADGRPDGSGSVSDGTGSAVPERRRAGPSREMVSVLMATLTASDPLVMPKPMNVPSRLAACREVGSRGRFCPACPFAGVR